MLAKHVVGEPDPGRPGVRTMLDARRLIVLREVARRGSFSAAAHALWITQPAVSRQIAALERELGRKVLERTPRGLLLTDAGGGVGLQPPPDSTARTVAGRSLESADRAAPRSSSLASRTSGRSQNRSPPRSR